MLSKWTFYGAEDEWPDSCAEHRHQHAQQSPAGHSKQAACILETASEQGWMD